MAERLDLPTVSKQLGYSVDVVSYPVFPSVFLANLHLAVILFLGVCSHLLLRRIGRRAAKTTALPAKPPSWHDYRRFATLALLFGLFSLGCYQRTYSNWTRTEAGLPLPWLVYPNEDHPGLPWSKAKDGFRVDILRLELVLLSVLLATALFIHTGRRLTAMAGPLPTGWRASIMLASVPAGVLGVVVPTNPQFIGAALGLVGIPLIVLIFTWRGQSFRVVFVAAAGSAILLWWVSRTADHLRHEHLCGKESLTLALLAPVILIVLYSLPVVLALAIRKLIARIQVRRRQCGLNAPPVS